jgi:DNA modification methylase
VLDEQSGGIKSRKRTNISKGNFNKNTEFLNEFNSKVINDGSSEYNDEGGCSKILNRCNYEDDEYDLMNYCPKVSTKERNAGCEELEKKPFEGRDIGQDERNVPHKKRPEVTANTHPTLKPISLITKIAKLFKAPIHMKVYVPFSGVASEIIGLNNAGYEEIIGCELSEDYCKIAEARIKHWCKEEPTGNPTTDDLDDFWND